MDTPAANLAEFTHVRTIMGMVVGLGMARLLNGLARFVQHPEKNRISPIHLGWTLYMLLGVTFFWWFEFALAGVEQWTFETYLFHILFASIYFFVTAVLYPDNIDEYEGFEDYFLRRKAWIYGLTALLLAIDVLDTGVKGFDRLSGNGIPYLIRQASIIFLVLSAIFVERRSYHLFVVAVGLLSLVYLIVRNFSALS
ncbi:hypothetical protein JM93_00850 [Roseibium hamelinense]|uniref:Uncharacterized protein n=1 Tax=Roseibium hamelinense TaxID=150831 RepID=A0A562TI31_9HYPH|nr:hypothetical protein [Roseibium hamelinense]MTI42670.1 hypothetical protein [Roseibium hamelinense]TWI93295.1 hypothetical protein JM93_00850 [Roseibium hamelinense]